MSDTIQSIFERAETAITKRNQKALALAVGEMITLAQFDHSLIEPLFVAATHLAQSKRYRPQAAAAFLYIAKDAPAEGALKQRALAALLENVDGLTSLKDRWGAYRYVFENIVPGSASERKATAVLIKDINRRATAMKRTEGYLDGMIIAPPGGLLERRMRELFVQHVDAFPRRWDRIAAYRDAAIDARPGSPFEQKAVTNFVRNVEDLPSPTQRISAYRSVAVEAPAGHLLQRTAVEGFGRQVAALPTATRRVRTLQYAQDNTASSVLLPTVIAGIIKDADSVHTKAERIDAFAMAADLITLTDVPPTSNATELERQALDGFVRQVEALPTLSQRIAAYRSVFETRSQDTPIGQRATAKLQEIGAANPPSARHAAAQHFVQRFG
jgi:hypothetical protein